jgi:hypothetical protein
MIVLLTLMGPFIGGAGSVARKTAEILKDSRTLYKRERYKTRLKGLTIIK